MKMIKFFHTISMSSKSPESFVLLTAETQLHATRMKTMQRISAQARCKTVSTDIVLIVRAHHNCEYFHNTAPALFSKMQITQHFKVLTGSFHCHAHLLCHPVDLYHTCKYGICQLTAGSKGTTQSVYRDPCGKSVVFVTCYFSG